MAIAAEALEGGELSTEARAAIGAAAAGHGRRLAPQIADEIRQHAAHKAMAAAKSAPRRGAASVRDAVAPVVHATHNAVGLGADQFSRAAGVRTGAGNAFVRLAFAVIAFIVALELASYISGRYFNWNLGQGAQKLGNAAGYIGLYPGQTDKLAQAKQAAQSQ